MAENAYPDSPRIMRAIDATWPAAEYVERYGWTLRRGAGGGKRVSAASGAGDIGAATEVMAGWGQPPLFRLTTEDVAQDHKLDAAGFTIIDPTVLYAGRVPAMVGTQSHMAAAYRCHCRPAAMEDIWGTGGIGPERLAIMDRVAAPSMLLMSRAEDRPAGVAFVAVDDDVAMVHAIEVLPRLRRQGAAILLIEAAARFAAQNDATWLTLAVTEANAPARALYQRLGMTEAGRYHYRIGQEESST